MIKRCVAKEYKILSRKQQLMISHLVTVELLNMEMRMYCF